MTQGLQCTLAATGRIPLHLSLACAPGEIHAIIGPSGSGKSTLLRALAGLYQQVSGVIQCADRYWLDSAQQINLKPEQRRVGLVFQHYALFPHLNALQNVLLAMQHLPRSVRREKARALLQRVNLAGLEQRYPSQLSGGQRQRVAVARALAADPELLLLDEPFSAVDQVTRYRLRRELALLRKQITMPIILVTHDLDEALQLADKISVLHQGRVLQTAAPQVLLRRPNSVKVAKLIGLHNIFTGTVRRVTADHLVLDWSGCPISIKYPPVHAVGEKITWVAPPQSILLQAFQARDTSQTENVIRARLTELLVMGPHVNIRVQPEHAPDLPLSFYVPHHYVEQQQLQEGMVVYVTLKAEDLHVCSA